MPYQIKFTDNNNKAPITVFDNTSNFETSLTFPGRNVTGYGQIIAENFLHLLENFARDEENPPVNAVEGQLWYDTTNGNLNIWDNVQWKSASGIQKGTTEPNVDESKVGELWVDTTNQQLRIFSGTRWILVGPSESSIDGLRYGPVVEKIADSDNTDRSILTFYIADVPVIIFSKDTFTPKVVLPGFSVIRSGINVNEPAVADVGDFEGGLLPKLYGVATAADSLMVAGDTIDAGKFLRSDQNNTTEFGFNIANNSGLTVGADRTFALTTTATSARIYNKLTGSSIDLQTNRDGVATTILRVIDNKVGINKESPDESLDVDGNIKTSGVLIVTDTTESSNLSNGSIRTAGGVSITKNLKVGTTLDVTGLTEVTNIQPAVTDTYDAGTTSKRWRTVRAKKVIADEIEGILSGNISGTANLARALTTTTSFQLAGDVISPAVTFNGTEGQNTKIFNTQLTANIISSKDDPFPNVSEKEDYVLTYRARSVSSSSSGLLKQTRDTFIGDLGVPIGAILPFAGTNVPYGFLLCDGSEVEIAKYPDLESVIGSIYNGSTALIGFNTFRLPDLRGRFPLGRDNMDNGGSVPLPVTGNYVDSGGGSAGRVPDIKAQTVGGDAGQSSATLSLSNLPEHTHSMQNNGVQYSAVRVDTAINPPASTGLGPTAPGQAQYFNNSGPVTKPDSSFQLGQPVGIMNPYLTINYIIRSGPPKFSSAT